MTTTFKTSTQVDFVVIGSGAAGGIVAKELSTAGFQVVVLEQGPQYHENDYPLDELYYRNNHFLMIDPRTQPSTFRRTEQEKAVQANTVSYGRCVGGGTVHYTGTSTRHHEKDFIERSIWGSIAGTGFADWPLTYGELETYYTKVEWELGFSGLAGANPFESARSKPYPVPPMPAKSSGIIFERAALKLGLHPFPVPIAAISQTYQGRSGCIHCGMCSGFGCTVGAKSSTANTVIPIAEKTGRCEIRPNSYVREISVDKSGRVTGAVYFDARKRENFQRAKAVVLCANAMETPRLLLLSKSNLFPNGLANSSGVVGKYLMFGGGGSARGTFEEPLYDYKSVQVTRMLEDFYDADPKRGFYGGGQIDGRGGVQPIAYGIGGAGGGPRWGADFKQALKENYNHTMTLQFFSTNLPLETNNVTLDPELKDAWGLPSILVTFKEHPDDMKTKAFLRERCLEILDATGAKTKSAPPPVEARSGHLMGTCRMGNNPKTSVVDRYHRAHDVPNLFVVDGSSFVTSARNHPTCTIEALAYRASEHMIRAAKNGPIKSSA